MAEPVPGGTGLKARERDVQLSWDEYSARWATFHLGVDPRRSSPFVAGWLRLAYATGRALAAARLTPGAITVLGVLLSVAMIPVGLLGGVWLFAAAGLVVLAALADSADGAVALITGRSSRLGAFQDSMADRVSEALWLLGLWLFGIPGILAAGCGALAWLHEYARARATAVSAVQVQEVTVAERPTRVMVTVAALVLGGLTSMIDAKLAAGTMTVVMGLWLVLSLLGTARLLTAVNAMLRRA